MNEPPRSDVYVQLGSSRDEDADILARGSVSLAVSLAICAYNVACVVLRPDADALNWFWATLFAVTSTLLAARMIGRWLARRRLRPRLPRVVNERPHPFP